jgi:hypothetical protein
MAFRKLIRSARTCTGFQHFCFVPEPEVTTSLDGLVGAREHFVNAYRDRTSTVSHLIISSANSLNAGSHLSLLSLGTFSSSTKRL